jgi:hypothetical protein
MRSTIAAVMLLATIAAADAAGAGDSHDAGTSSAIHREGFVIGFSLGAGDLGPDPCHDCGVGVGADFHLGAMASRGVAVLLEFAGVGRGDLSHGMVGVAAQWWPAPAGRFWLKGGIGIGSLERDGNRDFPDDPFDRSHNDYVYPTLFGSGGVEVVRSGRFAIDLQLRGATTHQRDDWSHSVSVNVGLNWY